MDMRLVIADDDRLQLRLLQRLAASWGYDVILASDGVEAWRILNSPGAPKLALLDWVMSGMDGLDIVMRLRGRPDSSAPYLILLSARDTDQEVVQGLTSGADDYITKPISSSILRARLEVGTRVLELQRCIRERVSELEAEICQRKRAEYEKAKLLAAIEQASEGVVITDPRGIIEYVNEAFIRMSGYSRDEVIGNTPRILNSSKHDSKFYEDLWATITHGLIWRGELVNRRADGSHYTEEMSITPTRDANGTISSFIAIKRDVTDRKAVEADLALEQYLVRGLMETIPDVIYFKDKASRFVRINKAMAGRLGLCDPKDAIGKTDYDFFSDQCASRAYEDEHDIIATGNALVSKEERETWPDGRITWAISTKMPLRGHDGEVIGTFGILRDITQRKQEEDDLRKSEGLYRFQSSLLNAIYDASPDGILVVDRHGTILSHNRRFLEIWRLEGGDRVGHRDEPMLSAIVPLVSDPEGFRRRVEALYADARAEDHCEIALKDGRTVERRSSALQGTKREYLGRIWFVRDITERKQVEATKAEEGRLAALRAEVGAALTGRTSLRTGLQECAEALVRWTGVAFARIWTVESPSTTLVLEASAGMYTHINGGHARVPIGSFKIGRIAQRRQPYLSNDVQADPEVAEHEWAKREALVSFVGHPLLVRGEIVGVVAAFSRVPLAEATTLAFSSAAKQIAQFMDARRAENALQHSEERARLLFNAIPHPAYVFDLDTLEFLEVNRCAVEQYGYSRDEFLAMKTSDIRSTGETEQLKEYLRLNHGAENAGQWKHRTKDGSTIDVEITYDVIDYGGRRGGLTIAQDITQRKKMELDLRHAQKLESVGRLASGIAHEINTPIQFVSDNLSFLTDGFKDMQSVLRKYQDLAHSAETGTLSPNVWEDINQALATADLEYLADEIPRALSQSLDGVERVATIVRAMKEFAHPQQNQKLPASLNEALASTLVVARNELKYVADVETDFGELPMVECHLSDLNQVFLNLLINACHAIAEVVDGTGQKGIIRVQTRHEGDWVRIAISDTGCGISDEIRGKVFDPFFTTKDVGVGTGQGLAISHSIVAEKHGGTLSFESEVGHGTTFHICLPISADRWKVANGYVFPADEGVSR
jgi:PAS domain S-box-containing protein